MSSLRLTLRARGDERLDLSRIVPDRLLALGLDEIAAAQILVDGRARTVAQHFDIQEGTRDKLVLAGDLSRANRVGGEMRDGLLVVESSVGDYLAADMRRGQVVVHGSAGDHVGSGQRGGYVNVLGDVGEYCAAAAPGQRAGMRGGVLRVSGSAGRFLGHRMRRGTVVVVGTIGEACASSMVAGTIVCCAELSAPAGVSMRRGSIVCLTTTAPPLHVGFTVPEQIRLSYVYLLLDALRGQLDGARIDALAHQLLWRSLGDRACAGMGEILWLA